MRKKSSDAISYSIGVVSDTHSKEVPLQLIKDFQKVDLIIHVGDFCSMDEYNFFKKMKNIKAVYGNMDDWALCQEIPHRDVFEFGGVVFGLFHGEGSPHRVLNFVQAEFKKDKVDVVIFGHSHFPFNERIGKVLYFNPGSPNDTIRPPYCSYGILNIKGKNVTGKIIKVKG